MPFQSRLSDREKEVLYWIAEGKTAEEIGIILGISKRTVEWHTRSARAKAKASNVTHTVARAIRLGVLPASAVSFVGNTTIGLWYFYELI